MDLRHLRYFIAVAEELHFGRAAERLHISQPPLSQQIRALEDELGAALFERTRRRVQLTDVGRSFLPAARRVIDEAHSAVNIARRAAKGAVGEIRVGFTGSLPFSELMPQIIYRFRRAYPDVQLSLHEHPSSRQITMLQDGELDVGFLRPDHDMARPPGIALHLLLSEPLVVAVNETHPLAGKKAVQMEELKDEPMITYARYLGAGLPTLIMELCRRAGFQPNVVQEAEEMPTVLGLVAAGLGISLVTRSMALIRIPQVRYIPLDAADAHSDIFLGYVMQGMPRRIANFLATAGIDLHEDT